MPKKPIFVILIAASTLTVACVCCPSGILPFLQIFQTPTPVPPTPTETATATITPSPTPTFTPTETGINVLACINDLAGVLYEAENESYPGPEFESDYTLVTYMVSGDDIINPIYNRPAPADLRPYQDDTASHERLWRFVVDTVPPEPRRWIAEFSVFTDGVSNSLGAVEQLDNPHDWRLEMDLEDARHFSTLSTTLVHELAHLLTLNDTQVTTDYGVFNNPGDEMVYEQAAAACPTYFMFEGCSNPDSYLGRFFDIFWPDIYDEWEAINSETDEDILEEQLDLFYQEYSDQFVSPYAATSPEEDIAESFMYFVFRARPGGANIAEQKYLFFYDYPELVSLREQLIENLCTSGEMR